MGKPELITAPVPPGKFVGVRHWMLEDGARPDVSTGTRKFMVSCWYPGVPNWDRPPIPFTDLLEPHVDDALELLTAGAKAEEKSEFVRRAKNLQLRSQRDAVFEAGEKRPVLIYYPGGQSHRFSNAGLCEALVVLGYVVFCLDAPRDAPIVVFPDGQTVLQVQNNEENYIWPRVDDVVCLLNQLPELNETHFGGTLDLDRIGMFGHSRGGYLSTICSVKDTRIRAAINMDGFPWGLWVKQGTGLDEFPPEFVKAARSSRRPLMMLRGDQGSLEKAEAGFKADCADTAGDFIFAAVHGWKHGDFGQTSFLCGDLKELYKKPFTLTSSERGRKLLDIVGDFFDTYVRGQRPRPRLVDEKPVEMDVLFRPAR